MKLKDIWAMISNIGIRHGLEKYLARKLVLSNQIAFTVSATFLVVGLLQIAAGERVLAPYLILFFSTPYLGVLLLNRWGHFNLSRIYLNFLPPVLINLFSGIVLSADTTMRFALVSVALVPALLFGITEMRKMLLGIFWVVLNFLLFDTITQALPKIQLIAVDSAIISINMNFNGLLTIIIFTTAFIYLQRLNHKAEVELSEMLAKVQDQQRTIEMRNQMEQEQAQAMLVRQMEVNKMKTTFVAMTSHEFRTPLTSILSSEELLRDYGDRLKPEERTELFGIIESSVTRMGSMLDKMLFIGRSDADLLDFNVTQINLENFCRMALDAATPPPAKAHAVTMVLHFQLPSTDALVDEILLRHCLSNLLSNAVKYSPLGGEVSLTVASHPTGIRFEVMDQGIGIPVEDLPHLFETFHRASNVGGIPGTGLGLVIVKRAVERHGGTMEIDSALGQGTRISFTLAQGGTASAKPHAAAHIPTTAASF